MGLFNTLLTDLPWQPRARILCVHLTFWHPIDFHFHASPPPLKNPLHAHPFLPPPQHKISPYQESGSLLHLWHICTSREHRADKSKRKYKHLYQGIHKRSKKHVIGPDCIFTFEEQLQSPGNIFVY